MPSSETCLRALRNITVRPCVQLDPDMLTHCHPASIRSTGDDSPPASMRLYGTWRPQHSSLFTLIQTNMKETMVYCHEDGVLYHASPSVQLAPETPPYTALLTQWCEDRVANPSPRGPDTEQHLLVFDLLSTEEQRPHVRGAHLRAMEHLLPKPICTVQWAGDVHALKTFIHTLPHAAVAAIAHTRNPLVLAEYPIRSQ